MEYKVYRRVPNLLRKYRRASGLKQQDVAKILGIKGSSRISRWEKGECIPTMVNALKLSILYRVMVDSLFIDLLRNLREETQKDEERYLRDKKG
ncbi:MAG: helix-turn-helix transcriptional regulator [Ignavibacteriaceae bacterium]